MIIKVTKNESIASVHTAQNRSPLSLFTLLQSLLGKDSDIFAKPNQENDLDGRPSKIIWEIEDIDPEIKPLAYTQADEETQHLIKALLDDKVNQIIKNRPQEQVEILKNALEIPDESDIYLVGDRVVLTNWGHIQNRHDAQRGVVFKLIGDRVSLLKVEVFKGQIPQKDCVVKFRWGEDELETKTDESGVVQKYLPRGVNVDIGVVCGQKTVNDSKFLQEPKEYKKIVLQEDTPAPKPSKFNWWWLLLALLLLLLGGLGYYFFLNKNSEKEANSIQKEIKVIEKKDITLSINWQKSGGDFDLHIVDSCGNLIDNFRKNSSCHGKEIKFIKQSQGFDCENDECEEKIVAKDGIDGKIKIIINQFSSKESPSKVKLIIKKGDEVKIKKDFEISSPHPMLKIVEPNSSDITFEWEDES
jgi:hypothetical protein